MALEEPREETLVGESGLCRDGGERSVASRNLLRRPLKAQAADLRGRDEDAFMVRHGGEASAHTY